VIDDNEMSMRDFCFHVGVMLCAVPAGGWVIWQMLWVIKFLGEFMLAWWGTHSQQQQQPLPTLPSYATSAGRDLALTAASPHTLQAACKLHIVGLNATAVAQLELLQQRSCFACAHDMSIHSSLAATLSCVSPLTFPTPH